MKPSLGTIGGIGGIALGFAFWPTLDDDFWKFIVVVIPTTVSVVSSLFGSWSKLSDALVKQLAKLLKSEMESVVASFKEELAASTEKEIAHIKAVMSEERENFTKSVVDEVWYRIETINKLVPEVGGLGIRGQKAEVRDRRSEVRGQTSEVRSQTSEVRDQKAEIRDWKNENVVDAKKFST